MEKNRDLFIMKSLYLLERIHNVFSSTEVLHTARLHERAFIRERSMPFMKALYFMLDVRTATLQTRLNAFYHQNGEEKAISEQAFSQLRTNFDHSPFETTVRELVKEEYSGNHDLSRWNGYHLLAVDNSYFQFPRVEELQKEFGVRDSSNFPYAGISVLFDVLHGWVLDPIITDAHMDERIQYEKHMDFLSRELPEIAKKSIILSDHEYPSQDLFEKTQEKGFMFVARCPSHFMKAVDTDPMGDSVVMLENGFSVRVVTFLLENGDIETLATNLVDVPMDAIIELYTLRWGIETMYFKLKRELCIEKFSGKSVNSVRQDFWASMVLLNAVAVFQNEADSTAIGEQKEKSPTYENRASTSEIVVTLRNHFISAGSGFVENT